MEDPSAGVRMKAMGLVTARATDARGSWPHRSAALAGAAVVTLAALVAATGIASRVPVQGSSAGVPDATHFDYSLHGRGQFVPLRSAYVERVLGLTLAGLGPPAATAAPGPGSTARSSGLSARTPSPPIELVHAFTNRDFAHAYAVPRVPFAARTNTRRQTRNPGEPTSCSAVGGSAWYRFVPRSSLTLRADTIGTDYPTSLGVFEGTAVDNLHQVGCATSATGSARVGFLAFAGEPYYFQVTGPVGGGDLHFQLAPHPETILLSTLLRNYRGVPDDPRLLSGGWPAEDFRGGSLVLDTSPQSCDAQGHGRCTQVWYGSFPGPTWQLVSLSSAGEEANGQSFQSQNTADGRLIAFDSVATNLVSGDTNGINDVFVHDRSTGRTTRESLGPSGSQLRPRAGEPVAQFNGSFNPHLSDDGRFVAYTTDAADLGPGDTCAPHVSGAIPHLCFQVALRDRKTGTVTLVSSTPAGEIGNSDSGIVDMTPDGRYILFWSLATNLADRPITGCLPPKTCLALLLWDRATRHVEVESVTSRGAPASGQVGTLARISPDGRCTSFVSDADNLVPADARGTAQSLVHDRGSGATELVSVTSDGRARPDPQAGLTVLTPTPQFFTPDLRTTSVSANCRYVSFNSAAGLSSAAAPGVSQVYVRDRATRTTTLASVTPDGRAGNGPSSFAILSWDGALIDFGSAASDLVSDDTNNEFDIFYRGWQQP